jgi:hypothetical protein
MRSPDVYDFWIGGHHKIPPLTSTRFENHDPRDVRTAHQRYENLIPFNSLLLTFGYVMGYPFLVYPIMGICDETGEATPFPLSHLSGLSSLFPSVFLLFFEWTLFGCHLQITSGKS